MNPEGGSPSRLKMRWPEFERRIRRRVRREIAADVRLKAEYRRQRRRRLREKLPEWVSHVFLAGMFATGWFAAPASKSTRMVSPSVTLRTVAQSQWISAGNAGVGVCVARVVVVAGSGVPPGAAGEALLAQAARARPAAAMLSHFTSSDDSTERDTCRREAQRPAILLDRGARKMRRGTRLRPPA